MMAEASDPTEFARDMLKNWDVLKMEDGEIGYDVNRHPVRGIVMRGPASLCGYVGVHKSHLFYGIEPSYDEMPIISGHGGLTFADESESAIKTFPRDYFWWGWDYAHYMDLTTFSVEYALKGMPEFLTGMGTNTEYGHAWTVEEVSKHVNEEIQKLEEAIQAGPKAWIEIFGAKRVIKAAKALLERGFEAEFDELNLQLLIHDLEN